MRWHVDNNGAEWTATVTPAGAIRLIRREVRPPYSEGGEPREEFATFEFGREAASDLADTLNLACEDARQIEDVAEDA